MVNWSAHTKHGYLNFQLKQHNTRHEKSAKALIDECKGAH